MKPSAVLAALFALILAAPTLAAESVPPASPAAETPAPEPAAAPVRPVPARPSALTLALSGIVEGEKAAMAKLKARLAAARDAATMQSVHREIEQLKLDTEVQMLAVQATDHRQNGRIAVAEQLEASIRALRDPQRTLEPAARPAPIAAPAPGAR